MTPSNAVITVPVDLHARAFAVVAHINGQDSTNRALALESECENLQALTDPTSQQSLNSLAAQLPILEALFFRLSMEAVACRYAPAKAALVKAGLQAQASYARTVTLLADLKQQRENTRLTLESESWG